MNLPYTLAAVLVMAGVTYLLRMLPIALLRRQITNRFVLSFLAYVPYAVLAAMTLPDVLSSTDSLVSALCGLAAAVLLALKGKGLLTVALGATAMVLVVECLI